MTGDGRKCHVDVALRGRAGRAAQLLGPHAAVVLNSLSALPRSAKVLSVPVPRLRKPGSAWTEPSRSLAARTETAEHVRIEYARASTVRQSLDALKAAGITRIFAEKISTRAKVKTELDRTLT